MSRLKEKEEDKDDDKSYLNSWVSEELSINKNNFVFATFQLMEPAMALCLVSNDVVCVMIFFCCLPR